MIIESLNNHYKSEVLRGNPLYPPQGMESKRIHFIVVISSDGLLLDIEEREGNINVVKSRSRGGKDAPSIANYMWDSLGYVTGYTLPNDNEKQQKRVEIQHRSFREEVRIAYTAHPDNRTFNAVRNFYYKGVEQLHTHPLWSKISSKIGHNITFQLIGESLTAAEQPELITPSVGGTQSCLVSGEKANIARLHPKVYIAGAAGVGAKLISFAPALGYDSYGKRGGDNAPISLDIAEGYAAAITAMRQIGSGHNVVNGDVTFLFFTDNESDFNAAFYSLFQSNTTDLTQYQESSEIFNIIALVPNVARISPRLQIKTTIGNVVRNIEHLYEYLEPNTSLISPLLAVAPYSDIKYLSPQFIVDYMDAILMAKPLPKQILPMLLRPKTYHPVIESMLRYYLTETIKTPTPMALDRDYTNTGYLLGRMLAVVERAQRASQPNISFTVKDALYSTLSVTPAAIFNRLFSLSNGYFRRIPTQGTTVYLKSIFGEVTDKISTDGVPMRLSLEDQSRFALGYQHQNRSFYTKKEESNEQDS